MKILIAGDFCPLNRVAALFENGQYDTVLQDVKDIVYDADYSIVNFECPVVIGEAKPIIKKGPNLKCSERGMDAVKWAGFNCVTLANNHFYDFGEKGVVDTLNICEKYRIDYVGGDGNIREASRILYKTIDNKTLAVINCCEHEFSIATETTGGSNPLNPIQQYYAIKEAREKANYVLVVVHGGHEHWQLPSPRMVETYRFFVDAGADAVVNHHQHCYSGYEIYKGKLIFYGLGNFCFDEPDNPLKTWYEGYAVTVNFTFSDMSFIIHPLRQCKDKPCIELLPVNEFENRLKKLNSVISDSKELQKAANRYYASCAEQYSNIFEPIRNRYFFGAKHRGWLPSLISKNRRVEAEDYICCESHRDKLISWFANK